MKTKFQSFYAVALLALFICGIFYSMLPHFSNDAEVPFSEFSTQRAFDKVKQMSQKPHFVGSENHESVVQYLFKELQDLGLEPFFQEGFTFTENGVLVKTKNIIAKLKGTKGAAAVLLLSHYDSAPHSASLGASDDASGVATILESIRVFQHNATQHKNDIIILFTDGEEVGLNGAALFVTKHQWATKIGVVLNFEARGSSGPSYMLMETNRGNNAMVTAFANAKTPLPASNSLMYSIYKLLPNDTDLTVFREQAKIQGYNFAFIDSHFNYHTMHDTFQNLDKQSLAHNGSYLVPLLNYFCNADLKTLNSNSDKVYFTIPFAFVSYSFSYNAPFLIVTFGLLLLFVFLGLGKRALDISIILRGFFPFLKSLVTAALLTFLGWKTIVLCYPQYNDILHGFPYNGHDYIFAFIALTVAICFFFYRKPSTRHSEMSQALAPIVIWLLLLVVIYFKLEGASFLIVPVFFSVLMVGIFVVTQRSGWILNCFLALPALIILVPFLILFPVGLGLKILFVSSLLTVLIFGLLLPVFGSFSQKSSWAAACLLIAIVFLVKAHLNSDYSVKNAKPNSLVYVYNADKKTANWATYDKNLDLWTKALLGENPTKADELNSNLMYSKYNSTFTYIKKAAVVNVQPPTILFLKDSIVGKNRFLQIQITSNRKVNRYDIFAPESAVFNNLKANNATLIGSKSAAHSRSGSKLLTYYVVDAMPLTMQFSIPKNQKLNLSLKESSFDLLSNSLFKIAPRSATMMATPFVVNDAIIVEKIIKPTIKL